MRVTKAQLLKEQARVKALKHELATSFKKSFHAWQNKVWSDFKKQVASGQTIVKISPELKEDLDKRLLKHYQKVAKSFVNGLTFDEIKASEEEENNLPLFWLPQVLRDIRNLINDQIILRKPKHLDSIIETTEQIGGRSVQWAIELEASYSNVLANKLSAREPTVSITETNWIAEASSNTALYVTTPILNLADKKELIALQNVSPNVTLKNIDFDNFEELYPENSYAYNELINNLTHPRKTWVNMGDSRVRHSHTIIDGKTVKENEPFVLLGGKVMYPSDTSLGVDMEEIYNCRCWAMYS